MRRGRGFRGVGGKGREDGFGWFVWWVCGWGVLMRVDDEAWAGLAWH